MSAANNDSKTPGGVTGKGFAPGQSGNPDGVPKWVSEARAAIRGRLWSLAQRHLEWVLSGAEPPDATEAERGMYSGATLEDRNAASRLIFEYSIPKPKATVGLQHSGPDGGGLTIQVLTYADKEKTNG